MLGVEQVVPYGERKLFISLQYIILTTYVTEYYSTLEVLS